MHGVTMKFKHTVSSDTFFPKLPVKHGPKAWQIHRGTERISRRRRPLLLNDSSICLDRRMRYTGKPSDFSDCLSRHPNSGHPEYRTGDTS